MEQVIGFVEFAVALGVGLLYNSSRFREKILEFQLLLDKEIAPIQQKQSEIEGELRRIDAVVKAEDLMENHPSSQDNNSLALIIAVLIVLNKPSKDETL
ncbi:MAG: hypothetical protein RID09_07010 [Coleofasciculus sp. G1-WW12-02]|uniref:hypothetical protein n=1 Tax=Coleofasciculus sp. G1-WW12-02 TaxID=3068483 RepID=UPI0032F406F4